MCVDLGYLTLLGWLNMLAYFIKALEPLHGFLLEAALAVIVEEMIFTGFVVNRVKPGLDHKWTKDFLVHHIASAVMGLAAVMFFKQAPGMGRVAVGLVGTEITTFLPVSFRESVRSRRLKEDGRISLVLGILFPAAFIGRTLWSGYMFKQLLPIGEGLIRSFGSSVAHKVVFRVGELGVFTVFCSNAVWTYRILRGSVVALLAKKGGKKLDDDHFNKEIK